MIIYMSILHCYLALLNLQHNKKYYKNCNVLETYREKESDLTQSYDDFQAPLPTEKSKEQRNKT